MLTGAARLLRCSQVTVARYVRTYPAVQAGREEEREALIDTAELKLAEAMQRGEAWAVCFTLKCLGKGRGYVERTDHAVDFRLPIEPRVQAQLDELVACVQKADDKTVADLYAKALGERRVLGPGENGQPDE